MIKKSIWIAFIFTLLMHTVAFGNAINLSVSYSAEPVLEYDAISNLGEGVFCAVKYDRLHQTTKKFLLDSKGNLLSEYDDCFIQNAGEGLIYIKDDKQKGFFDLNGNKVISISYENAYPFSEGLARVEGKYEDDAQEGFIDSQGNIKIPLQYDRAGDFHEGLAWVEKDGKIGYINTAGKLVIDFQYSQGMNFQEGLACVKQNGYFGYIDKNGKKRIPFEYKYATSFVNGRAFVRIDKSVFLIDFIGKQIKKLNYSGIPYFIKSNGYFLAEEIITYYDDSHEHLIRAFDNDGIEMTFEQIEMIDQFSEGLAIKEENAKFGFIDQKGNIAVPIQFDYAEGFLGGYAVIKLDGKFGIIENPLTIKK